MLEIYDLCYLFEVRREEPIDIFILSGALYVWCACLKQIAVTLIKCLRHKSSCSAFNL